MTRVRVAFAVALLAALAVGADEPKKDKDPPKAKGPVRLDFKALGEMLTDLGYEPKATDNNSFHKIIASSKEFTHPVWLSLSADQRTVWFYNYNSLPDGFEKAPAESWRKLLEKNDDIVPAVFSVEETKKRLALRLPIPNADITPVQLRKTITGYVDTIQQTKALWNTVNFLPEMSAAAKKVLADLGGTWKASEWLVGGKKQPDADAEKFFATFDKDALTFTVKDQKIEARARLLAMDGAFWIDTYDIAGVLGSTGLLKLDGGTMTLCLHPTIGTRPTEFTSTEANKNILVVFKRQKK